MIPKLIHKIWLGPNEDKLKYSNTWKLYFPDHSIIVWDNNTASSYIKEMITLLDGVPNYSFNFVSDMLRLLIIRDYGGIYLDHDIEIFKNFENLLQGSKTFLTFQYPTCDEPPDFNLGTKMVDILSNGIENMYEGVHAGGVFINKSDYVNACFIASEPNSPLINRAIELYVQNYFIEDRFKYPMSDWGYGPQVLSHSVTEHLIKLNGRTQSNNIVTVFERSFFHPLHGMERLINKEKYFKEYEKYKNISYTFHHHSFTNMKEYRDSIGKDDFKKNAHAFAYWYKK